MDAPFRGIFLIIAALTFFSSSDVMAKLLSARMPVIEIIWCRYIVFFTLSVIMVRQQRVSMVVRQPGMNVMRGLGIAGSAVFFMISLQALPMAEAATIGFVSPLLITMLAVPMLGEVVTRRRWIASAIGLLGVLIVVRPGGAAFQPAALWGIASSLSWAVGAILTRKMAGIPPAAMLLWSSGTGLVVMTALVPFHFVALRWEDVAFGLGIGLVASTGQFLMVFAYRYAAASLLAPFSYLQLLWASLGGWLVFQATPDIWTLAGGVVIAASGLLAARTAQQA